MHVLHNALHVHPAQKQSSSDDDLTAAEIWSTLTQLQSPASLPSGCTLALTVCDPRYFVNINPASNYKKQKKPIPTTNTADTDASSESSDPDDDDDDGGEPVVVDVAAGIDPITSTAFNRENLLDLMEHWPCGVSVTSLWDATPGRAAPIQSERAINLLRSQVIRVTLLLLTVRLIIFYQYLVRAVRDKEMQRLAEQRPDPINILLIQRPSYLEGRGFGCGWSIIIPSGWGSFVCQCVPVSS